MVRRGSTVRVRQRAFKNSLQIGVFDLARAPDGVTDSRAVFFGGLRRCPPL